MGSAYCFLVVGVLWPYIQTRVVSMAKSDVSIHLAGF